MDGTFGSGFDAGAALAAVPVPLVVLSDGGAAIAFANEAFAACTGYDAAACVGRPLDLLCGPETDAAAFAAIGAAIHGRQRTSREVTIHGSGGAPLRVVMASAPHAVGGGTTVTLCEAAPRSAEDDTLADLLRRVPARIFRRVREPGGQVRCYGLPDWIVVPGSSGRGLREHDCTDVVHPDDLERIRVEAEESLRRLAPLEVEFRMRPDGGADERWMRTYAIPRRDGETVVWEGVSIDVTLEKERGEWLAATALNIPGFIFRRQTDAEGKVVYPYLSPSLTRMIGLPDGVVSGEDLWRHVHPDDVDRLKQEVRRAERELRQAVIELRMMLDNGEEHWFRSYSSPRQLRDGNTVWEGVAVDVTSEKEASLRLDYLAHHDALTGLANRAFLAERLGAAIDDLGEAGEGAIALSHIVLAGLSEINETLGTAEGDAVLREAASRISEIVTPLGHFAARIGGNEFAVLRREGADAADAFVLELIAILSQPIPVDDGAVLIDPSAGTTVLQSAELRRFGGNRDRAATELMKRASMALSAACRLGAGSHLRYDDSLDHRNQHRMELRYALHRAIERDELVLHYQPLVELGTGQIMGAEALVRWDHPQFGMLRPNAFIPLAEESGLIGALGDWVLRNGLRQLAAWRAAGLGLPRLAVNASALQVGGEDFAEVIGTMLAEAGVGPQSLEIEITEGQLLDGSEQTLAALGRIRDLGVGISIDDFGAGHASFQYLRRFPVDQLKLDQMFVRQLVTTSSDAVIVRAIASLGRNLGLELVAEGVETRQQRDFLRQQGYALGQGYFFSPPVPAEAFARMLGSGAPLPLAAVEPGAGRPGG